MERTDWLEERKKGIGGSDAAAIIGTNPFMTNVQLWEIKTGRREQEDISQKECVKFGVAAEDHIRQLFALDYPEYEMTSEEYTTYKNKKLPFIMGSFDGRLKEVGTNRLGVWEAKTGTIRRATDWEKWGGKNFEEKRIPQNYYTQILHYFLVEPEFQFAILRARLTELLFNGENIFYRKRIHIRDFYIERKECIADLEYLESKECEFWFKYVSTDIRPPLLLPNLQGG